MDIAATSIALSGAQLQAQASIQVMDKAMDTSVALSQGLIRMMERSVQPHLGGSIDLRA